MKRAKGVLILGILALAVSLTGCLNDSGSSATGDAQLVIQAGVKDINKAKALGKSSVIKLDRLIITLRSSNPQDAVRRDTVKADTGDFVSDVTDDQSILRSYSVTPLRSWTVVVKTLDVNDSVIHSDSQLVSNLLVGQTRAVTLNLASRFVMYEARFSLPDSLMFLRLDSLKQQLRVDRMVMIVDGDTVIDSTRTSNFAPSPAQHSAFFDYIRVNERPDVQIEFHGQVGADTSSSKLFEYVFENVDPTVSNPPAGSGTYTGPSAEELGAIVGLSINIGKVGTVVLQPVIDPNVTTKRAAH